MRRLVGYPVAGMLPPPIVLVLAIALSAFLHATYPIAIVVPSPLDLVGIVVGLAGVALFVSAVRALAAAGTTVRPDGTPTALVRSGPYSFSRNPIYIGFALVALGVAIWFGSLAAFAGPIAFVVVIDRTEIPYEERKLRAIFDAAFDDFASRVRRWI